MFHQNSDVSPKYQNMAKPSISFYPKVERRTNKTGRVPIYARLVLNRQKTEYRLPVDVSIVEPETSGL